MGKTNGDQEQKRRAPKGAKKRKFLEDEGGEWEAEKGRKGGGPSQSKKDKRGIGEATKKNKVQGVNFGTTYEESRPIKFYATIENTNVQKPNSVTAKKRKPATKKIPKKIKKQDFETNFNDEDYFLGLSQPTMHFLTKLEFHLKEIQKDLEDRNEQKEIWKMLKSDAKAKKGNIEIDGNSKMPGAMESLPRPNSDQTATKIEPHRIEYKREEEEEKGKENGPFSFLGKENCATIFPAESSSFSSSLPSTLARASTAIIESDNSSSSSSSSSSSFSSDM